MLQNSFIAPSINITELREEAKKFDIVQTSRETELKTVMSNSFGFGGVNTCLVLESGKGNLNSKYMWALEKINLKS